MTNEEIKEALLSLEKTDMDFTVIQTGKESRKVNGMYKPDSREILIHNKNFSNENQLIYTAIHEYAHHITTVRREKDGRPITGRCHDTEFWAKMDDLVEKAIRTGVYKRKRSEEFSELIKSAKTIDAEIANLQGKLGEILAEIQNMAKEDGERFEDIFSHELKMKESTVRKCRQIAQRNTDGLGQDEAEAIAKEKSSETAEKLRLELEAGKTLSQTKADKKKEKNSTHENNLLKEKFRIERTIDALNKRLDAIHDILETIRTEAA